MPVPFVTTGIVRLTHTRLFANASKTKNTRRLCYSASVLLPKSDTETWQNIKNALADTVEIALAKNWRNAYLEHIAMPIKDGDERKGMPFNPEYTGHMLITTSGFSLPDIVDMYLKPITNYQAEIYDGVYVHAVLQFYPYLEKGKPGIRCFLRAIMKVADGERIKWNLSLAQRAFATVVSDMKKGNATVPNFHGRLATKAPAPAARPPSPPKVDARETTEDDDSEFGITIQNEGGEASPWDDERYQDMLASLKNRALTFEEFKKMAVQKPENPASENVTILPACKNVTTEDANHDPEPDKAVPCDT